MKKKDISNIKIFLISFVTVLTFLWSYIFLTQTSFENFLWLLVTFIILRVLIWDYNVSKKQINTNKNTNKKRTKNTYPKPKYYNPNPKNNKPSLKNKGYEKKLKKSRLNNIIDKSSEEIKLNVDSIQGTAIQKLDKLKKMKKNNYITKAVNKSNKELIVREEVKIEIEEKLKK